MSTRRVLIVGSGASGVHFAETALQRGFDVTMVDIAHEVRSLETPRVNFTELKDRLDDPVQFFLGDTFEGVVLPDTGEEFYGFPPNKRYVFKESNGFAYKSDGFEPLFSFAKGGLAQAWTGGCYPFNDDDLQDFPFGYDALRTRYAEVASRIGISGEVDDLARFLPVHDHLLPSLRLDIASRSLLEAYARRRTRMQRVHGAYMGRTRVATLSHTLRERSGCEYLGRCLLGCPVGALYTPSQTLEALIRHPSFHYRPGLDARHFRFTKDEHATALICRRPDGGLEELPVEHLVLAAGTLSSAAIFLRSWRNATGYTPVLSGLMDNRQVLMPFVQLRMVGKPLDDQSYQYHLVGLGIECAEPRDYVHCQITTLKAALLHPILQRLPFNLRSSIAIGRGTLGALGVVNVNFADTRRPDCTVTLEDDNLRIRYVPRTDEASKMDPVLRRIKRALFELGCVVPPGMQHARPMGASAHYAGLFPMTSSRSSFATTPEGRSWDVPNLLFADGSTFPSLPAKNLTFTLMANAVRVAEDLR